MLSRSDLSRVFSKNLRFQLAVKGVSQKEAARAVGVTPATFSTWCSGVYIPRMDKVERLARYFGCKKSDLIEEPQKQDAFGDCVVMVPVAASVRAGFDDIAVELSGEYVPVPAYIVGSHAPGSLLAVRVVGQSMYPRLIDGDTVIIHKQPTVNSGDLAVLVYDNEDCTIKAVVIKGDGVDLIPSNPEYAPRHLDADQARELRIVGKVIGLYRDMQL